MFPHGLYIGMTFVNMPTFMISIGCTKGPWHLAESLYGFTIKTLICSGYFMISRHAFLMFCENVNNIKVNIAGLNTNIKHHRMLILVMYIMFSNLTNTNSVINIQ